MMNCLLLLAGGVAPLVGAHGQESAHPAPSPIINQSGGRTRIIFDYAEPTPVAATPTPTPAATPTASTSLSTPEPWPLGTPVPTATPEATPTPAVVSTPEPTATPEPVATPTPVPIAATTPVYLNTPTPKPLTDITPTPASPVAEATTAPSPVEATPAPAVAEATPSPAPVVTETTPTPAPSAAPAVAEATPAPTPEEPPLDQRPAEVFPNPAKPQAVATSPTPAIAPAPATLDSAFPAPTAPPQPVAAINPQSVAEPAPQPAHTAAAPQTAHAAPQAAPQAEPVPDVAAAAESANLALPGAQDKRPASESVTINLINKLVQRGLLTKEDAKDMIAQAEAEAEATRAQAQADMFAIAQVAAAQAVSDQGAVAQAQAGPAPSDSDVRVTYIPEPVKTQIKEDIKMELVNESRASGKPLLGGPNVASFLPAWVNRVHPFFDLRLRYEGIFYPDGNDVTGAFPNFNSINTGQPFNTAGDQFSPQYNADQNRNRFRIRVRGGAEMDLTENFTTGFRIATGETNSPVTTNQTIGLANNGQGGQFSKYAIWLDRAYLKYEIGAKDEDRSLAVIGGRFDNPFFNTPLIWDDDLGFDGAAMVARYQVFDGFTPWLVGGAFPVYNTDLNFSSNQPQKFASYDKFLFGGQLGFDWSPAKDWKVKFGAAYYYFYNIEGKLSDPYTPQNINDAGNTDNSRPSFAQKGNTYMALRNIVPDASNDYGTINQWQYYGLATKFQDFTVTARIDYNGWEPVQVSLLGEYVQNLAFNSGAINEIAVNNRGAVDTTELDAIGDFEGSPYGWNIELRVGTPALAKAWDWYISGGYRYIGSDSVVDGFNDSDFGLGGTNMQGYTVGAAIALNPNVWLAVRWYGAENIAGPTYKVDVFQFDLNAKF